MTLWDEILEQPAVLDRLRRTEADNVARLAGLMRGPGVRYVLVAGRGTSDNAARYAQYLWGARNRLVVALAAPSLFGPYGSPPDLDGAVVVAISQSGQSPDVVSVVAEARSQGRPTIAITNDPDSPMAAAGDEVLALHAGEERAIAATKTYTAELLAVAMLSAAVAGDRVMDAELAALPDRVEAVLAQSDRVRDASGSLADVDRAVVLGRGYNLCTAFEWALKLQEMSGVLAQPFSAADLEHGPIAVIEEGFPVFAAVAPGPLAEEVGRLLRGLREERRARLVLLADSAHSADLGDPMIALPPGVPEWLSPVPATAGAQLVSYHLSAARGFDPDAPRHLRKVTRTR